MSNKKFLASLALLPILLSGCASAGSGDTPFFAKGVYTTTQSSPSSTDSSNSKGDAKNNANPSKDKPKQGGSESSDSTSNGKDSKNSNEGGKGKEGSANKDNEDSEPKNPDGTIKYDFAKDYAKEKGLKLDENGNPYRDSSDGSDPITSVTVPKSEADEETEANRMKASPKNEQAGMSTVNSMVKEAKSKNWKSACKFVYINRENSTEDCVAKMKQVYAGGVNYTNFTNKNVQSLSIKKEALSISLKGKDYEESQRTSFILVDGKWKVIF